MTVHRSSPPLFECDDFFVLRAPLSPLSVITTLGSRCRTADAWRQGTSREQLVELYRADVLAVRDGLAKLIADPAVEEAIDVSSHSLIESIPRWRLDPTGKAGRSIERSLLRYVTRSATRCTPYGLLAGVACGDISDDGQTAIRVGAVRGHRRHVRLDTGIVQMIAERIGADPRNREILPYRPNSTCYRLGGRVRYVETPGGPFRANGSLVSVAATPVVREILERAKHGARVADLGEVVRRLESDASEEDVRGFVDDLIASQVLVPDIFPAPTGPEMLHGLLERVESLGCFQEASIALRELADLAEQLSQAPPGDGRECLGRAAVRLRSLLDVLGVEEQTPAADTGADEEAGGECFQIDMTLDTEQIVVARSELESVMPVLEALYHLNGQDHASTLGSFIEEFVRRYDDKEVPISQVLDPDCGIPFGTAAQRQHEPSPLLRVPVAVKGMAQASADGHSDSVLAWLVSLLLEAQRHGGGVVELASAEIKTKFPRPAKPPAPATTALLSRLRAPEAREGQSRWLLVRARGTHCLPYLGRFAHVLDHRLADHIRECARLEQAGSDSVLAQVAYLPPGRLGNVCQQPPFREHTILCKCPGTNQLGNEIELEDLLVSVRSGEVVLSSRSLGCRIEPRIDHMLNAGHPTSPAAFNFLGLLQMQQSHGVLDWSWRNLGGIRDLPRVVIDDVVVAPRVWNLGRDELSALVGTRRGGESSEPGLDALIRIQEWRDGRDMPRWVAVGNLTEFQVFDLENPLSADSFLKETSRHPTVREAFIHEQAAATASGDAESGHVHEIVVPIWNRDFRERARSREARRRAEAPFRRSATPARRVKDGTLYARIYGGSAVLDKLLRAELGPFAASLRRSGRITGWFYVRYADPGTHLRLRLFGAPQELGGVVLPALEDLLDAGRQPGVWGLQFSEYAPETDRYGGPTGLALAERLFQIDSESAASLLRIHGGAVAPPPYRMTTGVEGRWLLAALSVDALLSDLGLARTERCALMADYGQALAREFGDTKHTRKAIGTLYRDHRRELGLVLDEDGAASLPWLGEVKPVLAERSRRLQAWMSEFRAAEAAGDLNVPRQDLIRSYLHMHCNRLFISQMRLQEMVLLQLMQRYYTATTHKLGMS